MRTKNVQSALDELYSHHRRYATINKTSQQSPKTVGQIMDARSGEPGLDTPHTRQRFVPRFTSAPHRLQAKTKIVPPAGGFIFQVINTLPAE
jgi:hypothetical protein